jgi:preprotein translocase subunit SecG
MMIVILLTVIHVAVCIALILIVLLQTGKGSELAGAFGGGTSNTAFGVTGAISFIGKMTTVAAFCFLFTSVSLSLLPLNTGGTSLIKEESVPPQAPVDNPSGNVDETKKDVPADSTTSDSGEGNLKESESEKAQSEEVGVKTETTQGSEEKKAPTETNQTDKKAP